MQGPKVEPLKKWIEFGETPQEGMELYGFSTPAILEGRELKEKILDLLREEKDIGFRKAVILFKEQGGATGDQALKVVREIREDWEKDRRSVQTVLRKEYAYSIDRVFWAFPKDVPKDPRYFKLNVIDVSKFQEPDSKPDDFDPKEFIRQNISEDDLAKLRESLKTMDTEEIAPESKEQVQSDEEWERNAPKAAPRPQKNLRIKRPRKR